MLGELIHKQAQKEGERDKHEYRMRPSSAGPERCQRSLVYAGMGLKAAPIDGRGYITFDDGHIHEKASRDWINRIPGHSVTDDQKRITYMGYTGSIDGIWTQPDKTQYLWEHKACGWRTVDRYWEGHIPLDYMTQMAIYMGGLELENGVLMAKKKDNGQYVEIYVKYDSTKDSLTVTHIDHSSEGSMQVGMVIPRIVKDSVDKFKEVEMYINNGKLPFRQYEKSDWHCGYCGHNKTCWAGYQEEIQARPLEGPLDATLEEMGGDFIDKKTVAKTTGDAKEKAKKGILEAMADRKLQKAVNQNMLINITFDKRGVQRLTVKKTRNRR